MGVVGDEAQIKGFLEALEKSGVQFRVVLLTMPSFRPNHRLAALQKNNAKQLSQLTNTAILMLQEG